jgi:hypothetical protein
MSNATSLDRHSLDETRATTRIGFARPAANAFRT